MVLLTRLGIAFTALFGLILTLSVALVALQRRRRQRHSPSPYAIQNTYASSLSVNSPGAGKAWLLPISMRDVICVEDKRYASCSSISLESCTPSSTRSLAVSDSFRSNEKRSASETWKIVMGKVRALLRAKRANTVQVPEIRITFPDELAQDDEETLYYATISETGNTPDESEKPQQQVMQGRRKPRIVVVQMSESGSGAAFVRDLVEDEQAEISMYGKTAPCHLENVDLDTVGRLREK
ncbi:uncharacterized protein V1513DRAFT_404430 [Lipomyces chichibuensis]|uniref:uncharacterized protein n=1 Tax=Lipomyces chichibuensis TaxID=1546026 RepID=UPI003342EE09